MSGSKKKEQISRIILYIVAFVVAFIFIIPIYFTIINAVNNIGSLPVISPPKKMYFENFVRAITMIPFGKYLHSSMIIVSISVSFAVFINYILGFAFSRMNAPGKDLWFGILISLMMVPTFATSIPTYILFANLKITNSYLIWILIGLGGSPFYTFLFRQFLQGIPKELEEAARIDGCGTLTIMFKIFAPLVKPVLAVVFMFEFLNSWGDVVQPFMFLNETRWPLSTALMGTRYVYPNTVVMMVPVQLAAALLFMIPSVFIYFFGQKYIKEGMITSGLKG